MERKTATGFKYDIGPNTDSLSNILRGPGYLSITGTTRVSAFAKSLRVKIAPHNQKLFTMWNFFAAASAFAPLSTEKITYGFFGPFVGTSCLSWTLTASLSAYFIQFFPVK